MPEDMWDKVEELRQMYMKEYGPISAVQFIQCLAHWLKENKE